MLQGRNGNRHSIGMRRFIFLFLGSIVLVAFFISQHEETETPLPVKLEKAMNVTSMNVYRNEFYGYTVYYPSFFEQVPDSLINETGCCQFRFWNKEEIVQTAFVLLNSDSLTLRQGMERFARELHADDWRYGKFYPFWSALYSRSGHQGASFSCQIRTTAETLVCAVSDLSGKLFPGRCTAYPVDRWLAGMGEWKGRYS